MTIDGFNFEDVEVELGSTTITIGNMTVSLGTIDSEQ